MIFQHTIDRVLDRTKTQTRRIRKPGQRLVEAGMVVEGMRAIYAVGQTYAAQPGRGRAACCRIRLTAIRSEDVRTISDADVAAEGFGDKAAFLMTWTSMHDKLAWKTVQALNIAFHQGEPWGRESVALFDGYLASRPAERYAAWALTFEIVASEALLVAAAEMALHDRFAHKWVNGEWFDLDAADIAYIKSIDHLEIE